jgi:hypothetical protein
MERTMRTVLALVLGTCLLAGTVRAQLGIGAEVQLNRFGGTSRDTAAGSSAEGFRPYRPVLYTLRPEWRAGRIGIALGLTYGRPDVAEEGPPLTIVVHDATRFLEIAPEVSVGVLRTSADVRIRVHGGPVVDIWQLSGEDGVRSRPGGQVALSAEFPVVARLRAVLRSHLVLTKGLFREGDLPPDFELRSMHRFGLGLGLRYGR